MNNLFKNVLLIVLFLLSTLVSASILVVVDERYFNGAPENAQKVIRYENEVDNIDGKSVVRLVYITPSGTMLNQCVHLWRALQTEYQNSINQGDVIEGAVFIGDLPIPIFKNPRANLSHTGYDPEYLYPSDYLFMDLGYYTGSVFTSYPNFPDVWESDPAGQFIVSDRYLTSAAGTGDGDEELEIWVSRIYSKSIKHLRSDGVAWDTFMEEHEIINYYLDRVHNRMTFNAVVPPRGFSMGYPVGDFGSSGCRSYLRLDNLNLDELLYFEWSAADPFAATSSKWQSQLQDGPYGNENYGAFKDIPFNDDIYGDPLFSRKQNFYPQYFSDTRGYEWASVFEHSNPNSHTFNYGNGFHRNGGFSNLMTSDRWLKARGGGYDGGSSYMYQRRNDIPDELIDPANPYFNINQLYNTATWRYVIPLVGDYDLYMYYEADINANAERSWLNIRQIPFGGGANTSIVDRNLRQDIHSSQHPSELNWEKLNLTNSISCQAGDTIVITLCAGSGDDPGATDKDLTIADAVWFDFNCNSTPTPDYIVDNDDPGFSCAFKDGRGFLNMQNDGGQSKCNFFLVAGCQISAFNYMDNLGLLYGMGHNGLTMMGNSYWNSDAFGGYTQELGAGRSFGEAFLEYCRSKFRSMNRWTDTFCLFGAGTLKSTAYFPYVEHYDMLVPGYLADGITKIEYVKHDAIFSNGDIVNNSDIYVKAGHEIRINPEFHVANGCEVRFKIHPELSVNP